MIYFDFGPFWNRSNFGFSPVRTIENRQKSQFEALLTTWLKSKFRTDWKRTNIVIHMRHVTNSQLDQKVETLSLRGPFGIFGTFLWAVQPYLKYLIVGFKIFRIRNHLNSLLEWSISWINQLDWCSTNKIQFHILKEIISHAQGDHLFLKLANISVSFRNEFLDRVRSLSLDNLRHKKS